MGHLTALMKGQQPREVDLWFIEHGNNCYIRINDGNGLDLILNGNRQTMLNKLTPIIDSLKAGMPGQGIINNNRNGNHRITIDDLDNPNLTSSDKIALLIERFPDEELTNDLLTWYKRVTGKEYKTQPDQASQLEQDLETVYPHLAELIQDGQLAWGAKSRIAKLLGGDKARYAGAMARNRVDPVVDELLKEVA